MSNAINQPGQQAVVSATEEMAALDSLGPILRKVITNAPLQVLAFPIRQQIAEHNAKEGNIKMDPLNPEIDAALARGLIAENFKLLRDDCFLNNRPIEDAKAGVNPLRRLKGKDLTPKKRIRLKRRMR